MGRRGEGTRGLEGKRDRGQESDYAMGIDYPSTPLILYLSLQSVAT